MRRVSRRGQTVVYSLSLCNSGFQDLLRVRPSSLLMLHGCIYKYKIKLPFLTDVKGDYTFRPKLIIVK